MKKSAICAIIALTLSLLAHSQQPAGEVAPMALPADNVELVDVDGRKITATVLSMAADKLSIVVRLANGKEMPILMSRLNADTVRKLTGVAKEEPVNERQLRAKSQEVREAVKHIRGKELVRIYQENDPRVAPHIAALNYNQEQQKSFYRQVPDVITHWVNPLELISQTKPVAGEEQVSLRPEFEKLGVKAAQQVGQSCSTYSAQHLLQYVYLRKGLKPPTIAELMKLSDSKDGVLVPTPYLIKAAGQYSKSSGYPTPKVCSTGIGSGKLFNELVKHQLRNKRAVVASTPTRDHAILIVGFHTKNGKTTWEYLDSNRVWDDKGYKTIAGIDASSSFSMWFE